MKLKERAKKLKTDIPAVFLALKHGNTLVSAREGKSKGKKNYPKAKFK